MRDFFLDWRRINLPIWSHGVHSSSTRLNVFSSLILISPREFRIIRLKDQVNGRRILNRIINGSDYGSVSFGRLDCNCCCCCCCCCCCGRVTWFQVYVDQDPDSWFGTGIRTHCSGFDMGLWLTFDLVKMLNKRTKMTPKNRAADDYFVLEGDVKKLICPWKSFFLSFK